VRTTYFWDPKDIEEEPREFIAKHDQFRGHRMRTTSSINHEISTHTPEPMLPGTNQIKALVKRMYTEEREDGALNREV
jgi:hypothetical protein